MLPWAWDKHQVFVCACRSQTYFLEKHLHLAEIHEELAKGQKSKQTPVWGQTGSLQERILEQKSQITSTELEVLELNRIAVQDFRGGGVWFMYEWGINSRAPCLIKTLQHPPSAEGSFGTKARTLNRSLSSWFFSDICPELFSAFLWWCKNTQGGL